MSCVITPAHERNHCANSKCNRELLKGVQHMCCSEECRDQLFRDAEAENGGKLCPVCSSPLSDDDHKCCSFRCYDIFVEDCKLISREEHIEPLRELEAEKKAIQIKARRIQKLMRSETNAEARRVLFSTLCNTWTILDATLVKMDKIRIRNSRR